MDEERWDRCTMHGGMFFSRKKGWNLDHLQQHEVRQRKATPRDFTKEQTNKRAGSKLADPEDIWMVARGGREEQVKGLRRLDEGFPDATGNTVDDAVTATCGVERIPGFGLVTS